MHNTETSLQNRITKTRKFLKEKNIDCLIISSSSNIFYLTGIYGIEGYLCITKNQIVFFTGGIYYGYVYDKLKDISLVNYSVENFNKKDFIKFLKGFKKPSVLSCEFSVKGWKNLCLETEKKIHTIENFIAEIRAIKEKEEIEKIQKAEKITISVLKKIKSIIKAGISEIDISSEIYYQIRKHGAEKEAFPPVVASGINSSYPHHIPTKRKLEYNDIIVIDMGASVEGYCADITETMILGNPSKEVKNALKAINDVHQEINELIADGERLCRNLHIKAVKTLKKYGLDKFFTHSLGHGVGIDVHELPILGAKSKDIIKNGMVFTIEPGVYIPGQFGIRIEKMFFTKLS